jgi:hypothetical protein
MLHVPEPKSKPEMQVLELIKELPAGALKSWGQLEWLCKSSKEPLYLFILNIAGDNPVLQFKEPVAHLKVVQEALFYNVTNERVAEKKFFNRDFLPTFYVFDNYMHVLGFEARLKAVGFVVHYKKFE